MGPGMLEANPLKLQKRGKLRQEQITTDCSGSCFFIKTLGPLPFTPESHI